MKLITCFTAGIPLSLMTLLLLLKMSEASFSPMLSHGSIWKKTQSDLSYRNVWAYVHLYLLHFSWLTQSHGWILTKFG